MAHVRLSPLLGGIAGSLGGVTFNRRGGALLLNRRRARAGPPSNRQLNARLEIARRHALWLDQSDFTQNNWRLYSTMHHAYDQLGQARTRTPEQWFHWWVPWAEAGLVESLTPDYDPPNHSILTLPLDPISLDFTDGGPWDIEVSCPLYPAYDQFLRIQVAAQNVTPYASPRIWRDCGFLLFDADTVDLQTMIETAGVTLQPNQAVAIRAATITKGVPNYWPSVWTFASTTVQP